jgi:hypothetical protein
MANPQTQSSGAGLSRGNNYDNNQHAENENLRLQNLWDGIETMAAIMTMK